MIIDKENKTQKARHRWLLERESLSIARTETNLKKKIRNTYIIIFTSTDSSYLQWTNKVKRRPARARKTKQTQT